MGHFSFDTVTLVWMLQVLAECTFRECRRVSIIHGRLDPQWFGASSSPPLGSAECPQFARPPVKCSLRTRRVGVPVQKCGKKSWASLAPTTASRYILILGKYPLNAIAQFIGPSFSVDLVDQGKLLYVGFAGFL